MSVPRRPSILKSRNSIGPLDLTKSVIQDEVLSTTLAIKRRVSFSSKPEIRHIQNDSKSDNEHSDMDITLEGGQFPVGLDKTKHDISDMDITATEENEAGKDASIHLPYDMEVSLNKTFIGNIENISDYSENIENSNSITSKSPTNKGNKCSYMAQQEIDMDITNFVENDPSALSHISYAKSVTLYQTQDMSMNSTNSSNPNLSNSITRNKTLYQTQNMNLTATNLVNISSSVINRNQTLHQTQDMNMTNINSNSANNMSNSNSISKNKTLYQSQDMNITNYNNTSNSNNTFYQSVQTQAQDTPSLSNNSISANRTNSTINKNTLYQTQEMELTNSSGFGSGSGNSNNNYNQSISVLEYSKGKTLYQTQAMELTGNNTFANIEKESNSGNNSNSNMDLTCGIVPNPNAEQENTFNNKMQSSDMEMTSFAETPSKFINKMNKTPISQFKLNEEKPILSVNSPAIEPSPSRRFIKNNKDKRINEPPMKRNIFSSAPNPHLPPSNRPVPASNVNLPSLNILDKIRAAKTPRRPIIPKSMLNPISIPSAIAPKKIQLISSSCQTSPHLFERVIEPKITKEQGCNVSVIMTAETGKDICEINKTNINDKSIETIRNNLVDLSLGKSHDLPSFKINNTNNTENIFIQKEAPSLFSETTLDQLPCITHLTLPDEVSPSSSENSSKVTVVAAEEITNSDPTSTDPSSDSSSSLTKPLPSNSSNSPLKIEEASTSLIKNGNENDGKSELDTAEEMSLLSIKDTINNNQSSIITDLNITSPKYNNQTNENETLSENYLKNTSKDYSVRPEAQKITINDSSMYIFDPQTTTLSTTIAPQDLSEEKITISEEEKSFIVDANKRNENISASNNNNTTNNKVHSNETTTFEPLSLENISCGMDTITNTNNNDNNTIVIENANCSHSSPVTPVSASKDTKEEESMEIEKEDEPLPLLEKKEKSQLEFNAEKTFTCEDNNIADDVDIEIVAEVVGETCTDLHGKENCLPNETIVILNNSNESNEKPLLKLGRKSENFTGIDEISCSGFYEDEKDERETTLEEEDLVKERELSKIVETSIKNFNSSIFTNIGPKLQFYLNNYNKLVHLEKSNAFKDALKDLKKLSQEQFGKLVKSYPDIFDNEETKRVYTNLSILTSVKKSSSKNPFFDNYRKMFYSNCKN